MRSFLSTCILLGLIVALAILVQPADPQTRQYGPPWANQADLWRPKIETTRVQSYIPVLTTDDGNTTPFTFERAAAPLTTPTSDATGDCLHPDVIHVPGGFGDHNWWMVMTPFAAADLELENPEILYSDDGTTWTEIASNPIDPWPGAGKFNSDPCLMLYKGRLYCYYREADATNQYIRCRTSDDGETWSAEITVLGPVAAATEELLSPIVRNINGTYFLWTVDIAAAPNEVNRRSATSPIGTFASPITCSINTDAGEELFHIHILWDGDAFYGLWRTATPTAAWLFARSYDGLDWDLNAVPLHAGNADGWDEGVYQAAIIKRPGFHYFDVFYSAIDAEVVDLHRIGRGKLHWACGDDGEIYGYKHAADGKVVIREGYLTIDNSVGGVMKVLSRTAGTAAGDDPRIHFQAGVAPATKTTFGYDLSEARFVIAPSALHVNPGFSMDSSGNTTIPTGLIIPSGTVPTPATEGALFLDTDAGANGTLVMYSNGDWRTVQAF